MVETIDLRLRSAIPGRERWEVDVLRSRRRLAEMLEERLRSIHAFAQVQVNAVTGRILVVYDQVSLRGEVRAHIEAALGSILQRGLPAEERPRPGKHPLRALLEEVRPEPRLLAAAPIATVIGSVLNFLPYLGHSGSIAVTKGAGSPFLASLGIKSVRMQLALVAAGTVGLMFVNLLFENFRRRAWNRLASRIEQRLQIRMIDHLLRLDMSYLEEQKTGGLMRLVQDDTQQIYDFFQEGAHDALHKISTTVAMGVILLLVSPVLALITFLPFPVVLLSSRYFQRRVSSRFLAAGAADESFWHQVANSLSGAPTIKSFTAEEHEVDNVLRTSERVIEIRFAAFDIAISYANLTRLLTGASFALAIMTGGMLYTQGAISFATYSLVLLTVPQLASVLGGLDASYAAYQGSVASARRILDLLAREPRIVSGPVHLSRAGLRGDVAFEQVAFGYSDDAPVFEDLTIEAPPRETTALVGPSGSGKTTVVKLLMRYYDVDSGRILLDGVDVRELDLFHLRDAIGYVSQDVYLFHGTVTENIAYGRRDASRDEIVAAARMAEAHEFIERLPQGYETVIGERGQKLSGGQRQRISIARAVLKDPPILVLDEATSALDSETEAAIHRSMRRLATGRTTIVIAHRLSTVQHASRIYVIDNGQVIEKGTHQELLEQDRLYAALWKIQSATGHLI
jgi:ATP-binding cassette subfamily B protein